MQYAELVNKKSRNSFFEYVDRGYKKTLVMIPGWATDYRIFSDLDLMYNYLIPKIFSPFDFNRELVKKISEDNINKISILGYSMGGFLAVEFALGHKDVVDELILVSVRKEYDKKRLAGIKKLIQKAKDIFLHKFYLDCFSSTDEFNKFKSSLLVDYIENNDADELLKTLDFLGSRKISAEKIKNVENIKIIHGEHDKIAPIGEALELAEQLHKASFVSMKGVGHFPFYRKDFAQILWH